ncbi:MAG TPA: sialidase family protein [Candidatus Baltobacteraceae bacterium]|nr:sialidase family protein [Candidatus Baltobacteraceae bacterium]
MDVRAIAAAAMVATLAACGGSGGTSSVPQPSIPPSLPPSPGSVTTRISTDTFADSFGQHATEVEPSAAVHGETIVAAFQIARQLVSGGSAIGVATSFDGGATWSATTLPGVTRVSGGSADSASDAVAAYDNAHNVWLVAQIPIVASRVPYPEVSRSSNAIQWTMPVPVSSGDGSDDKEWIACDNAAASRYYGHCYVTWDDDGRNGLIESSTSVDGGITWSPASTSADAATGIGAQARPLPNGDVVVVSDDFNEARIFAFTSHDGGATWGASVPIAAIIDHFQAGNLRSGALVSSAVDTTGALYAVWQDCRFEVGCASDDLLYATSAGGAQWSAPRRIPLDPVGSGVDHFIPGLGTDPTGGAHLGLAYYTYANAACASSCRLAASYASSPDGGATWTAPVAVGAPMANDWLARTTEGRMVADYVATVFAGGRAIAVFADAAALNGSLLDESIYASTPSVSMATAMRRTSTIERPVPGIRSDHRRRHFKPE